MNQYKKTVITPESRVKLTDLAYKIMTE